MPAKVYIGSIAPLRDASLLARALDFLSADDRARILQLRRTDDRCRSLAAMLLLRHALRERGITEYTVARGEHGKPFLAGQSIFFNLSHAGEYAMCAVSDCEIGCDIERIDPEINLAIADRYFCEDEARWMREGGTDAVGRFFRLWTLKESLMKATGKGFALSPRSFSFCMDGDVPRLEKCPEILKKYVFSEDASIDGYRLAFCMEESDASDEIHIAVTDLKAPC